MNRWRITLLWILFAAMSTAQAQNPLHWLGLGDAAAGPAAAAAEPGAPTPAAAASPDPQYVIGPGDVLAIDVWKEPEITQTEPVRPDGDIAVPLAGTLHASGLTPAALGQQIESKLAAYVSQPVVTVMVTKVVSRSFQVLGAVLRPGSYTLVGPTRVLQALAEAGGFTPFANRGQVVILHRQPDGGQVRYQFDYNAVIHGDKVQQNRLLQPGDSLIVP